MYLNTARGFQAEELFARGAKAGADYIPVSDSSVILNTGDTQGFLPVIIRTDGVPELPERFRIRLNKVELVDGPPANPSNAPKVVFLRFF